MYSPEVSAHFIQFKLYILRKLPIIRFAELRCVSDAESLNSFAGIVVAEVAESGRTPPPPLHPQSQIPSGNSLLCFSAKRIAMYLLWSIIIWSMIYNEVVYNASRTRAAAVSEKWKTIRRVKIAGVLRI